MPRPVKEIPEKVLREAKALESKWSLADQLSALIFRKDNLKLLSFLETAQEIGGLPFTRIGQLSGLGTSQKLVDTLNYMVDYGLVNRTNGNYKLTKLGLGTAGFAERLLKVLSKEESRYSWVNELLEAVTLGRTAGQEATTDFRTVRQKSVPQSP